MRVLSTITMEMRLLGKGKMTNELLSTRTLENEVAKHKNDGK